jgi:hypothetical protein
VTTAFDLIAPLLAATPLESQLHDLLREVDVQIAALTDSAQALGEATAASTWSLMRRALPVPAAVPSPLPGAIAVDGRLLGAQGWEIGLTVPSFQVALAGVMAATVESQHGRDVAVASGDDATLSVTAGRVVLSASNGTNPELRFDQLTIELVPAALLLPGGFGAIIGTLGIGIDGIDLPDLEILLPPLPQLPTGPIPVPANLRHAGGLFADVPPFDLPEIPGFRACSVAVTIDRPDATSLADLIPTRVEITVPVAGLGATVPDVGHLEGDPVVSGAPTDLSIVIGRSGDRFHLEGSLSGGGDETGLLRVGSADARVAKILACAGALGPYLADEVGGAAQLAVLAAAAGALAEAIGDTGAAFVLHGVSLAAEWTDTPPGLDDITVAVDYECALPLMFSTPLGKIGTDVSPYRVRYREVAVRLTPAPGLSWKGATSTIVSPGDWTVAGPIKDLLRISGVRTRHGSVEIEIDLALALDLDVVKVHGCTLAVHISGDGVDVTLPGFDVSIDVPGTITGSGALEMLDDGFRAVLDIDLPALGAGGRAAAAKQGDMVMVAIEANLFAPIPLASSGLGLYGLGGVLAANAEPAIEPMADPITSALQWDPMGPDQWTERFGQYWMGFKVKIGTVPDFGFALMGSGSLVLGVPSPALRAAVTVEALRGLGGELNGVFSIDTDRVLVAVQGKYDLSPLVIVTLPAGAEFIFADPEKWSVRLGGDGSAALGQPAVAKLFPDVFQLEAWMFLMAFGDADVEVGAGLAGGRSLSLHGMSLAFGAGFDVEWSAGPFSFEAGGVILAAVTHRPTDGGGPSPWVLAGLAELHGRVDLGPVSIGASAELKAFVDPAAHVFYADAHACASIDLWFTELEGCVRIEIGSRPQVPAPEPASPLLRFVLTDRLGNVVGEPGPDDPVVWPDAVPVLVFDTWVAEPAAGIAGLGTVIGDNSVVGNGWVGTDELKYRFELRSVRVVDAVTDIEVSSSWSAAWQLPLTLGVFGAGAPPARARSLALNVLDLHHWLQPATVVADDPAHAFGLLGSWCIPIPAPGPSWFPGGRVSLPPSTPVRFIADPAIEGLFVDGVVIDVFLEDEVRYAADEYALAMAAVSDRACWPAGVHHLGEVVDAIGHAADVVCWLPMSYINDSVSRIVLVPSDELRDVAIALVTFEGDAVRVSDESGTWVIEETTATESGLVVTTWRHPEPDRYVREFEAQLVGIGGPVAVFGVSGLPHRVEVAHEQAEAKRKAAHDAIEQAANSDVPARRLLGTNRSYRVEASIGWEAAGTMYSPNNGVVDANYRFSTAHATPPRPPSPPLPAGRLQPAHLFDSSLFAARFGQSELADADLGRYVAGFVPEPATGWWFTDDPVQAHFVVDHLRELCTAYDSHLEVEARRTDAPVGTPPAVTVARVDPLPTPPMDGDPPIWFPRAFSAFTALDRGRLERVIRRRADDCPIPRPGAVTDLGAIEPQADYSMTVAVARNGGVATVLRRGSFTTSRYANPLTLFADLGFRQGGDATLNDFPLPDGATLPTIDASFDGALEALGLGGYGPAAAGGSAALWLPGADGSWQFAGVLVECPEPIRRAPRLGIDRVLFDAAPVATVLWDGTGSRFVALRATGAVVAAPPSSVSIVFTDAPPATLPSTREVVSSIAPYIGRLQP